MSASAATTSTKKKNLTAKELIAERARIDAAMAKLDEAKVQARTHRAEYGKFLQWKVDMQRKERKQRDNEDELMRERVELKLQAVLQQHRQDKLNNRADYRKYIADPVPKQRPLNIPDSFGREAELAREAEESVRRRNEEWESTRLSAMPHSAPLGPKPGAGGLALATAAGGGGGIATRRSSKYSTHSGSPQGAGAAAAAAGEDGASASASGTAEHIAAIEMLVRDTRPRQILNTNPSDEARARELQSELAETEQRKKAADARAQTIQEMFHKARTRRLYAMGRIASDPPADYLIGTDILKYIPVDLIPGASAQSQSSPAGFGGFVPPTRQIKDDSAFFMTAVGEHGERSAPLAAPSDAHDVSGMEQAHHHGGSNVAGSPNNGGGFRARRYNPNAWMKLPNLEEGGIRVVPPERNREEEQATLEWYKLHMRRYAALSSSSPAAAAGQQAAGASAEKPHHPLKVSETYNWTRPQDAAALSQGSDKTRRKSQRFDRM